MSKPIRPSFRHASLETTDPPARIVAALIPQGCHDQSMTEVEGSTMKQDHRTAVLRPTAVRTAVIASATMMLSLALCASRAAAAPTEAAAPAGGSSPTLQHVVIEFGPIPDEIMTPACGFDVSATISLRGVDITFIGGQPSGLFFLSTFRNQVTFSANGRSVVFNERGHESIRLQSGVVVDAPADGTSV